MKKITVMSALVLAFLGGIATAQEKEPKFKANVPENILTPDKVETQYLGTLDFFDGLPSDETVKKTYDFLYVSRGVEAFLNGMPAASIQAMLEGLVEAGVKPGDIGIFESLMDARTLFLTPNSTTQYITGEINLIDGPIVMEINAPVLGCVDDAFFRFVTDIGLTGPDRGQEAKYLFVGPDYNKEIPEEEYIVIKTPTYRNWLMLRAFVKDGDLKASVEQFKNGFNIYPLSQAANPPEQKFHDLSGKQFNTIHANDAHFFEELNEVVQYEPADAFNPELVGLFASIGIKKDQPFTPDEHMQKLLNEAAAIANASARAICFRPRKKDVYFYPDRQWFTSFSGGSHEFMDKGELVLDDRVMFHYGATVITPSMTFAKPGTGSAYAFTPHDSKGNFLDGGKTYKVTLPTPIPVNNFWSFMVYSTQHRSMLETDQKFAGLDSNNPSVKPNKDGSYTMWFGPEAPEGHEGNWIQTIRGKGYCVILRLYGPLEPWYDKIWKPGDFELVE